VTLTTVASPAEAPGMPGPRPDALPEAPAGADLADARPALRLLGLCFGLTLLIYLALAPRFMLYSSPPTGDQAFYLMTTASLTTYHDLNERRAYANHEYDKFYSLAPLCWLVSSSVVES